LLLQMPCDEAQKLIYSTEGLLRDGDWENASIAIVDLANPNLINRASQQTAAYMLRSYGLARQKYPLDGKKITLPQAVKDAFLSLQEALTANNSEPKGVHEDVYKKVVGMQERAAQMHHDLTVLRADLNVSEAPI